MTPQPIPRAQRRWLGLSLAVFVFTAITVLAGPLGAIPMAAIVWLLAALWDRSQSLAELADEQLLRAEAETRAVRARLDERDAELIGFITTVGRDLHTPMTNVAAYSDLLTELAAEELDRTCLGFIERIGVDTRRMSRLVVDLLDYTDAGRPAPPSYPVDLRALAAEVTGDHVAFLSGTATPNIEFGQLPTVMTDADAVYRLLDHLVDNALKYVRHGDTPQVRIAAYREPDSWRIDVTDRGIGVPADQSRAIFTAFHRDRAANGYPGSGLGLAICRRIADQRGGLIGVDSNPGGGSRFWFTIPDPLVLEHPAGPDDKVPGGQNPTSEANPAAVGRVS